MRDKKNLEAREGRGTSADSAPDSRAATRQLELRILRALRRIIQAVDQYSRKLSSTYKLTTPQLVTLLCVADEGPITASAIARSVHLSNSTVVGILDRLEVKELIRRQRSSTDRRIVHVTATDAGRLVAESAPVPLQDVFAEALHALPELERTAITLSLERVVELMEAKDIDAAPVLELGEMRKSTESP